MSPTIVEAWDIPDPAGRPIDEVRAIRDGIEARVRELVRRTASTRSARDRDRSRAAPAAPAADAGRSSSQTPSTPEEIRACADAVLKPSTAHGYAHTSSRSRTARPANACARTSAMSWSAGSLVTGAGRVMTARVGINGFGRMGRLALRAAWGWPELAFMHVNELAGDAATAAHLLTFDSIHGRWSEDVHGEGDALDGQRDRPRLQRRRRAWRRAVGRARRGHRAGVLWPLPHSGAARRLLPAGRAQGHRRGARQGGRAQRRRRRQRRPLRARTPPSADRRLVHDELPRARREGHPRGDRHPARADHDAARHDQHADARSTRRTRTCAGHARRASR